MIRLMFISKLAIVIPVWDLRSKLKESEIFPSSNIQRMDSCLLLAKGLVDVTDFTLNNIGNADLIIYLSDDDGKGFAGIAPIGTLCIPSDWTRRMRLGPDIGMVEKNVNAWKSSINEYQTSVASFGTVSFKGIFDFKY